MTECPPKAYSFYIRLTMLIGHLFSQSNYSVLHNLARASSSDNVSDSSLRVGVRTEAIEHQALRKFRGEIY